MSGFGEAKRMADGCAAAETTENRDQGAPVEEVPALVRELEARLADLEARVEVVEKIIRRKMW